MEASGKYRFTLQWGSDSQEKVQAGELLNGLGNRKSEFIVMAVTEYAKSHPDILSPRQKIKVIVKPALTREQVEEIVRSLIKEQLAGASIVTHSNENNGNADSANPDGIDEILRNLEFFQ